MKWIRIGQITVRLWYNHILEAQTGQVNLSCSLVYLLRSNLKCKVRYLWTDKNIYSQSLTWIRIGQITFRLRYNHILEAQMGQVNFRCSLVYMFCLNWSLRWTIFELIKNIYSQSLNWIRIGQITFRLWYNHFLEHQMGQVNFRCSLVYLLRSNLNYKVRYL